MESKTIDITPTWEGILPVLVEVAVNGTSPEGRRDAMNELRRLARIVDTIAATEVSNRKALGRKQVK